MLLATTILTILVFIVSGTSHKNNGFGYWRPKCCSDTPSQPYRRLQPWTDSLREATYQSIIHHLDFQGTLDARIDRDEKIWKHLQAAKFNMDKNNPFEDYSEETKSGILIETPQTNQRPSFEFQQTDKSDYDCSHSGCYTANNSILALWRVRKSDSPSSMWIRVKLPKMSGEAVEDMYYYSGKFGLKKLSPDPTNFNHYGNHRFSSLPKKKSEFKHYDRMDFPFSGWKGLFGAGSIIPSAFMYEQPNMHESEEDDWHVSSLRNHHTGDLETEFRNPHHRPMPGFYGSSRPEGIRHIMPSFPSISPPQHLDHPSHDIRGFMPSAGPISAPPFRSEHTYDPRYILYYHNHENSHHHHTTVPPKYFKPSTEYVRYSEIDPFFHPNVEAGIHQLSPHHFDVQTNSDHIPNPTKEEVPTSSPNENTKLFQIIVKDPDSNLDTTTKPTSPMTPDSPPPTSTPPHTKLFSKSIFDRYNKTGKNRAPFIAFGEKIKPKTPTIEKEKTSTSKPKFMATTSVTPEYSTDVSVISEDEEVGTITSQTESHKKPSGNGMEVETTLPKESERHKNSTEDTTDTISDKGRETTPNFEVELITNFTQSMDLQTTTEMSTDITTIKNEERTLFTFATATENNTDDYITNVAMLQEGSTKNMSLWEYITTTATNINKAETANTETATTEIDSTNDDNPETTNPYQETTTETTSNTDFTDFFSSLSNLFGTDSTTEISNATATTLATKIPRGAEPEPQESKHHKIQYRLLTFPGDPVSIVANRISKTVSYRTAAGKERKLKSKQALSSRYNRFSNLYKD